MFTPCVSLWSILCQTFLLELMFKPSLGCWPAWVNNTSNVFLRIPSSHKINIFPLNSVLVHKKTFEFVCAAFIAACSNSFYQLNLKFTAAFSTTSLLLLLADGDEW